MSDALENLKLQFEREMRANGPMIYTLASRLMGNTVEGQDLAQQTFVSAYEHLAHFRGESAMGTWFYRICINLWKNKVRSNKRKGPTLHLADVFARGEEAPEPEIPGKDAPLSTVLEAADRQVAVKQALELLGPEERALIVLRDIDAKTYEEIGELLEIPMGTVKSRLSRAREQLRQILVPVMDKIL